MSRTKAYTVLLGAMVLFDVGCGPEPDADGTGGGNEVDGGAMGGAGGSTAGSYASAGLGGSGQAGTLGVAGAGGAGGAAGQNGSGTFTLTPDVTTLTMRQLEQHLLGVKVARSNGFKGPISVDLVGAPPGLEAEFSAKTVAADANYFSINFKTPRNQPQHTNQMELRASAPGAPAVNLTITLNVVTRRVYTGGFTMGTYTIYSDTPSGDRCQWNVSWNATVEMDISSLQDSAPGTLRVSGMRYSVPVQAMVGNTTCASSSGMQSGTGSFNSTWPVVGGVAKVVIGVGSEEVSVGGPYSESGGAVQAKAKIKYVRSGGGGESAEALSPLFLKPL
ncbi:MAG TPA: hypothetical protein VJV78_08835 [Polyangiales bacterium]|nr:hypothetical protein [Polyangiales bacterium]